MSVSSGQIRVVVGAIVISAIVAAGVLLSPSALFRFVESVSTDPLLFGLVVIGLYLLRPLLALPTTPLAVVVGYGYGVMLGVPIALVGVVTTVIPVFLGVRWVVGSDTSLEPFDGPFGGLLKRTGATVSRYYDTAGPTRGVIASRLAPIPSDISTCAAAISGVGVHHLVIGTAIGELPWTVAAVIIGASAATMTTDGLGELGLTLTVACSIAAIALLAGPAYRVARTYTDTNCEPTSG